MNHASIIALSLVAASLAGCGRRGEPEPERPLAVRVAMAAPLREKGGASYSGEVVPRTETQLAFLVAGRVETRLVEVGSHVKAGDVLARLEPADFQIAAASANAGLAQTRAEAAQTTLDRDRGRKLIASGAIAKASLEQSETSFDSARARLDQAKSGVDRAGRDLSNAVLHAPADGVVTAITMERGQVVSAGQPMLRIASDGAMEVQVSIPEARIHETTAGAAATVRLWSDGDQQYAAHVRELAPEADATSRTYRVKLVLDKPDARVHFGMSARALFVDDGAPEIAIPLTAIFDKDGHVTVWIFEEATGRVTARAVTIERYSDGQAVIAKGLVPGDKIVTAGVHRLDANAKVVAWNGAIP